VAVCFPGESMELTKDEINFIIESLQFTKKNIENYTHYPSYEFKLQRIEEANNLISKMKGIRNENQSI
jgi:hypothetical protein